MAKKTKQAADVVPLKSAKCPTCGEPAQAGHKPFCSVRCANADLGRWLNGDYRIPTDEAPGEGDREGDMEGDMEAEMEAEAAAGLDDNGADKG